MADVFISYRRNDTDYGVAGWLADSLNKFSVFLDVDSIKTGTYFEDEVNEELDKCRVVLAVIGVDWIRRKGELEEPDDWVRLELTKALSRRDVTIIPLWIEPVRREETAAQPADLNALGLPQELAALARIQTTRLKYRDAAQIESLIARLEELLAGRAKPTKSLLSQAIINLCDRTDQEEAFVDLIAEQEDDLKSHPIACVVHGYRLECPAELINRLRDEKAIEDVLQCRDVGIAFVRLQLSNEKLRTGQLDDALRSALRTKLLGRSVKKANVPELLRQREQPLVVVAEILSSDVLQCGEDLVKNLVLAWRGLAGTFSEESELTLQWPALLFVNLTYLEADRELDPGLLPKALPKLESVELRHIYEWVALPKVSSYVEHRTQELFDLASNEKYCHVEGRLHMSEFSKGVVDVMSKRKWTEA